MSKGITTVEAIKLQKVFGMNVIQDRRKISWIKKFIEQISSFLIILLLIAAGLSFFIGETIDGSLILIIIFINAGFGMFQEFKADQAVAALKQLSVSSIRVIRDGKEQEIDSKNLVPGDLIIIEEGVKIPADTRIVESHNLEVNESSLTGESFPVVKNKADMVFMGTIVSRGRAQAIVMQIGMKTKFGKIAENLATVGHVQTPLQKKLAHLTEVVGLVGIIISLVVFVLSALQGQGAFPSFLLAISLAVAVVPESLPAAMTVILSIGVKHMAKRNAIVRKLAAIEAIGNTTLIATDKTGTLTENKMTVKELWFDEHVHQTNLRAIGKSETEKLLLINGILCSTASLVDTHGGTEVLGDPTEGALLMIARDKEMSDRVVRGEWELVDEISFDSIQKRMSVLVKHIEHDDKEHVFSKGAPESILHISSHILIDGSIVKLTDDRREEINAVLEEWSRHGLRVLAFAYQDDDRHTQTFQSLQKSQQPEFHQDNSLQKEGMVFLGMAALHDPPRKEVLEALERAASAGIKVVMITGDNEKTSESIGVSIGLMKKGDAIITGDQIDSYSDEKLLEVLPHTKIFARTTPIHKSRIVSLFQALGEVVTVTGDGVNDAVALKQADVGVAMGKVGTDVAREVADMVILDDNFATIVNAVEEGRNIVVRLNNSIKYLLTGNLTEGLVLVIGLVLGFPPILIPIQLLYINLISDGVPALAMGFSPKSSHVMSQKPDRSLVILKRNDIGYIALIGIAASAIVILSYTLLSGTKGYVGGDPQTVAFTVLAIIQAFIFVDIWVSRRSDRKLSQLLSPIFLFTVAAPILIQFTIIRSSFLSSIFRIQSLQIGEFVMYVFVSASILGVIGVARRVRGG
ncbi:hypothetical protein CO051_06855 [Candidatus Roizmanbacteria bacterium CG_4_9_14_0_2_um_filter_39_13]|uniref:Cation-transporting P-type ATPase N-terminal domain-containing protein n=1 Tax=Candidatus Roizmanbacteria bacterium CG_4_9_14_0_2_um_filter_39_13 TaxID=1974839 RepID=A0A2M8EWI4_9BACT|nr:MAG: hypothetical protein COY15_00765 [Candidatus Roizmanbacteria bacterium CG_4_10_14_0_2_um_filter_39_12]PJC30225.1 MAG: hypothetical protein CO051_06855 [Candidatus Roizmanbacteria bacterium CG_4_9_14_0_2_um_filter_39_13]